MYKKIGVCVFISLAPQRAQSLELIVPKVLNLSKHPRLLFKAGIASYNIILYTLYKEHIPMFGSNKPLYTIND